MYVTLCYPWYKDLKECPIIRVFQLTFKDICRWHALMDHKDQLDLGSIAYSYAI